MHRRLSRRPIRRRLRRLALLGLTLFTGASRVHAQTGASEGTPTRDDGRATRAAAVGVGLTTGILGVEYVWRGTARAPRLGAAVGVGVIGPGARVMVALAPSRWRLVPWVGVGAVSNLWGLRAGVETDFDWNVVRPLVALEGGVQLWPGRERGFYVDVGAGVLPEARSDAPVLARVLVGRAFR